MPDTRKWPGYRQDGEAERMERERRTEEQVKARNLSGRMQARFTPDQIDPATGRTFRDGLARGMYDDSRVQDYREQCDRNRETRERYRWAQARMQGRQGRN